MKYRDSLYVLVLMLLPTSFACAQTLKVSPLFGSGAVLQQEMPVPVWGWVDEPGQKVTVIFDEKTYEARSDQSGRWQVTLDAMKAKDYPKPLEMVIRSGEQELTSRDILIGEVWLMAGQSNVNYAGDQVSWAKTPGLLPMSGQMDKAKVISFAPAQSRKELRTLTPQTRLSESKRGMTWNRAKSLPQANLPHWYARSLQHQLDIPVGVVKTAIGGSNIISWISEEAARREGGDVLKKWQQHLHSMERQLDIVRTQGEGSLEKADARVWARHYPGANFNAGIHPLIPMAFRGVVWYQGEANVGDGPGVYQALMRAMIQDWRKRWGNEKMPIIFAQISTMQKDELLSGDLVKALEGRPGMKLLESQRQFAEQDPHAMMAPNLDIGGDIHPLQKPDIAARLALATMVQVYGSKVQASGPVVTGIKRLNGDTIELQMKYAEGLFAARPHVLEYDEAREIRQGKLVMERQYDQGPRLEFTKSKGQPVRGIFVRIPGQKEIQEVPARIKDGKILADVPVAATSILGGTTVFSSSKANVVLIGNVYNGAFLPLLSFEYPLGQ